jgi:GR25 family glycosyltransferase involved in LPS biosynthesis
LILEDDFSFTSDLEEHLTDLRMFLARNYDYWICLIATSKFGAIEPIDDLMARCHQPCTNTAGYLVSPSGRQQLIPIFARAAARLRDTKDVESYAVDRCWSLLQASGKFLVFRRKFGFQASSFSNLEARILRNLD